MGKNTDRTETKERIIKAFLDIIGQKGDLRVTVRDISKKANVNLAAVNYYFRTKQNLLDEIEKYFFKKVFDNNQILDDLSLSPKQRILNWAQGIIVLLDQNPGIIWVIANKVIKKEKDSIFLNEFIHQKDQRISRLIKTITGINDPKLLSIKTSQIISGITSPLIFFYGLGKEFDFNLDNTENLILYTETLINSILNA
ncbi:MAG: TetR/AcrR family transcriptional regulator [Actinomycetota bacterium]|jgi:AcrR family transcriptional regulator|nr:TetR/AcrR family transcriptional regulator [Actinomycetota bacterium]